MPIRKALDREMEPSGLPLRWAVILSIAGACSAFVGVEAGLVPTITVGPSVAVALNKLIK